jgi:hypothetical protein
VERRPGRAPWVHKDNRRWNSLSELRSRTSALVWVQGQKGTKDVVRQTEPGERFGIVPVGSEPDHINTAFEQVNARITAIQEEAQHGPIHAGKSGPPAPPASEYFT